MDSRSAQEVEASLRELVRAKKNARYLVEEIRVVTYFARRGPVGQTLLAALRYLKPSKSEGEENKAIRAVYEYLQAVCREGKLPQGLEVHVSSQLEDDFRDDGLLPRQLAAVQLFASVASRYPSKAVGEGES